MMVPLLLELKKRHYAIIQLDEGMLINEKTNITWLDKFAGSVPRIFPPPLNLRDELQNEWEINWFERKVISDGINFYQGLFERITQVIRGFSFNINDPNLYKLFAHHLLRIDYSLSISHAIKKEIMDKGMPVRFINCGSHAAPYSVYRSFALKYSEHYDVGFIHMGSAYENYYTNLKNKHATTVCLENLTKFPNYRLPFLARPDLFDKWLSTINYADNKQQIERLLKMDRVLVKESPENESIKHKLERARQAGKNIIGVYGKILCDMGVPYDGGPGHTDIADWLKHTVSLAETTDNILLLKPHPHELRPEIARDLSEQWLDLIDLSTLPENVIVLPHNGWNNFALIEYLSAVILWNGTSSLELTAQGIPVVMASYFGKHDYPIELIYPESRLHYEQLIKANSWKKPDENLKIRAALLLQYMGSDEVCIPYNYAYRPVTNDPIGTVYWHKDEISKLLTHGDSYINKMADKVF